MRSRLMCFALLVLAAPSLAAQELPPPSLDSMLTLANLPQPERWTPAELAAALPGLLASLNNTGGIPFYNAGYLARVKVEGDPQFLNPGTGPDKPLPNRKVWHLSLGGRRMLVFAHTGEGNSTPALVWYLGSSKPAFKTQGMLDDIRVEGANHLLVFRDSQYYVEVLYNFSQAECVPRLFVPLSGTELAPAGMVRYPAPRQARPASGVNSQNIKFYTKPSTASSTVQKWQPRPTWVLGECPGWKLLLVPTEVTSGWNLQAGKTARRLLWVKADQIAP